MGFPFDTPSWDGVSGAIFMGVGSALPGILTLIAIGLCILALGLGQTYEVSKFKKHK